MINIYRAHLWAASGEKAVLELSKVISLENFLRQAIILCKDKKSNSFITLLENSIDFVSHNRDTYERWLLPRYGGASMNFPDTLSVRIELTRQHLQDIMEEE